MGSLWPKTNFLAEPISYGRIVKPQAERDFLVFGYASGLLIAGQVQAADDYTARHQDLNGTARPDGSVR